jgi:hypothetical protein
MCDDIPFSWKKLPNFERKIEFFFLSHLDFESSLVAFLKLFFSIYKQALKTSHHFMLNLSWDASQRCNIKKLK